MRRFADGSLECAEGYTPGDNGFIIAHFKDGGQLELEVPNGKLIEGRIQTTAPICPALLEDAAADPVSASAIAPVEHAKAAALSASREIAKSDADAAEVAKDTKNERNRAAKAAEKEANRLA